MHHTYLTFNSEVNGRARRLLQIESNFRAYG
jgi:hypothetical protein